MWPKIWLYSYDCRWFHKFKETDRLVVLRRAVEEFDERRAAEEGSGLEEEHWRHLVAYLEVVKPFEEATKVLGGDSYPASTMVIPMLDQVPTNIAKT